MVSLVRHDLEYILKQIKIAERHAAGEDLRKLVAEAGGLDPNAAETPAQAHLLPYGLRTVDGTYNNLVEGRETWGAANQPFPDISSPNYLNEGDDGMMFGTPDHPVWLTNNNYTPGTPTGLPMLPPGTVVDADPRLISNLVADQTLDNPAAIGAALNYAGITGAAQKAAILEIQSARAAIADAIADAGSASGAIAGLQAAVSAAEEAVTQAEAALIIAQEANEANQAAHADDLAELQQAQDAFDVAYNALMAIFEDGISEEEFAQLPTINADYLAAQQQLSLSQQVESLSRSEAEASTIAVTNAQTAVSTGNSELATAQQNLTTGQADAQAATAAIEAAKAELADLLAEKGIVMDGNTVLIPNVAPDIGDSAPYNSMFTLFGQFFDHGLDLIAKGGSGTVYIPLSPDDPLYNPASPHTNFMVLTRASRDEDDAAVNVTTPWVDQNQTYTSHASHQLFLREYTTDAAGKTVATGRLLEGDKGLATWADVKEQARAMLGIDLTDAHVGKVPLLRTDPYGNFIPHPQTGYAQVIVGLGPDGVPNTSDDVVVSGTPTAPASLTNAILTGHAFLDDIAHAAVPVFDAQGALVADGDSAVGYKNADGTTTGLVNSRGSNTAYDDEMLDAHYITGDGRGNENIGLTAIHHIFHSEHNHLVDQVKALILSSGDVAFLNEWLRAPVSSVPTDPAAVGALQWDGERLFQAARFTNEMEYQHLVFEEFGRKMQPDIDAFVFEPSVDINPAIFAEFAQAVYRFGHSMLNENIDIVDAQGNPFSIALFDGFLNPLAFGATDSNGNVIIDHEQAAGAIIRGMSRQHGNEIDEFITHVLRNQLVAIPLDLAALNIARGRDLGLPSLNEARAQFYQMSGQDSQVKPYVSWADFGLNIKHPLSIINFIAAYGRHSLIVNATTLEAKRAAATLIVLGGAGSPTDRLDFLNSTGAWATKETGLNDIDLWIGGLAEKKMDFGGMLGSTFSFVFELQMESLQDADRFYYLSRVQGLNLLNELENNSLSDIIMRNTDLGDEGRTALPGDIFATPAYTLEIIKSKQRAEDPTWDDDIREALSPMVVRKDTDGDGKDDVLIYHGTDHVVMGGSSGNDYIVAGEGDDTVWAYEGNDTIEAGYGVDIIHGGDGDDIITNAGTDIGMADKLHGEAGNDVIQGGSGMAILFGNQGQDFLIAGPDGKQLFGGTGNDFLLGGDGGDFMLGNEGDDWVEGGARFDVISGDNSELFFNSSIIGHDVLNGGSGDTDYDAESGDDIMFQGEGIQRNNGMAGFDWAIHKGDNVAANSDLGIPIFGNQEAFILRDRFDLVEGLSGWKHNDVLTGRVVAVNTRAELTGTAAIPGPNSPIDSFSNALLQKNVSLINGLDQLVAHLTRIPVVDAAGNPVLDANGSPELIVFDTADASDIILGGGGSDTIKGFAGNDIIDGDKWLNVRIRITTPDGIYTADGMSEKVYRESDYEYGAPKPGAVPLFGGKTLDALMLSATLNPGQLSIVREIVDGDLNNSAIDVAVYGDVRANYVITSNADGSVTVQHVTVTVEIDPTTGNSRISDGTDRLFNIEKLRFADGEVSLTPPKLSLHAFNNGGTHADNFTTASYSRSDGNRPWATNWIETGDDGSASSTNGQIQITSGALRFDAGNGAMIERGLNLTGIATARLTYSVAEQGFDANERVEVWFSRDGVTFTLLETIGEDADGGTRGFDISGPFTSGAKIRFVVSGVNANNEFVNIDNVAVSVLVASANPTVNYATSFTEGGQAVAIANNPGIVDDAVQMLSARIVLTNAQADDELNIGTLPAGISANVATVAGQIIVTLTGSASLAAYQRAIQAVTFDNDSQNPVAGSRVIQVTVNDGILDSNVATTTINVIATNDPPNAQNDIVFTNVTTGPFLIPEWALLANDTDLEGDTLDITAVSGNNAFQASLTANPGFVTLTDIGNPGGTFSYTASDGKGGSDTATVNVTRDTNGAVEGNQFDNILIGNAAGSTFDGGTGNDTILAGGGDDTIVWNANNNGATDGTDFVDGGSGTDTFDLNTRPGQSEIYRVYTRAEADDRGVPVTRDETEIVITRTVGNTTSVVAELDNIEEIRIGSQTSDPFNGSAGPGDTVQIFGDFSTTSLALNTITINGNAGDDTVDISGLTSAHRIVFRSRGGNDTIVGTLRPQDVIELEPGRTVDEYEWEDHEDGTTTITAGVHRITFRCEDGVRPTLNEAAAPVDPQQPTDPVTPTDPVVPVDPVSPGTPTDFVPGAVAAPEVPANLVLRGSSRSEALLGGDGHDRLDGGRGHDKLFGGAGNDRLHGGDGHDRLDGGTGADRMWGGRGNDVYIVDDRNDRVFESRGQGIDTVKASVSYSLGGTHVERLMLTGSENLNGAGNGLDNLLVGNSGNNVLKGGRGEDTLRGMSGDDVLIGGAGNDRLTGGSGADTFVFQKGGGRDVVTDFRHSQDDIDVSRLNGVNSLSDLDIRQEGRNTLIQHEDTIIVLKGVNASDLDSNDFIF